MNSMMIALFVATGGCDAPDAPVRALAGKAQQIEAVVAREQAPDVSEIQRPAIHDRGDKAPAYTAAIGSRSIA